MTGVLKARVSGNWVNITGPGATGPQGPQGIQGPAGPQQLYAQTSGQSTVIGLPPSVWTEYGVGMFTLPYTGRWMVQVWASVGMGAGGSVNMAIGINHSNEWRAHVPGALLNGGGITQLVHSEVFALAAGALDVSAFIWTDIASGSARSGGCSVVYAGP